MVELGHMIIRDPWPPEDNVRPKTRGQFGSSTQRQALAIASKGLAEVARRDFETATGSGSRSERQ